MTDEQGVAFWERQEGESATAYSAFCTYRDMGLTRSLRKASEVFYADRQPDEDQAEDGHQGDAAGTPPGAGALRRFKEWSRQNMWRARVEAFDLEETRKRSLWLEQERTRMIDNHIALARQGESVASKKLFDMMRDEADLPGGTLPALMEKSANIHRLAVDEATERMEVSGELDGKQQPDLSHMTDEELETLDRLYQKIYGPPSEADKAAAREYVKKHRKWGKPEGR